MDMFLRKIFFSFSHGFLEFLPISSSGHLFFISKFISTKLDENLNILINLATTLVIIIFYIREIIDLIKLAFNRYILNINIKNHECCENLFIFRLILIITLSTFLSVVIFFRKIQYILYPSHIMVLVNFFITSIILCLSKFKFLDNPYRMPYSWLYIGFLVGLGQGIAIMPGISRLGITYSLLKLFGFKNLTALKVSLLSLIPVVLFGSLISFYSVENISSLELFTNIFCAIVSFGFGVLGINFLLKIIKNNMVIFFAYYLWLLIVAVLFFVRY